jgi:predicted ArsR family transcriptional regulator
VSANPADGLDPALFTATVTSLTHSFGDTTRRKVYLYLRENPGATAAELAEHCCVHPNVVRHHLERLAEGGYVTFDNLRKTTVGRPAKGYRVVDEGLNVEGSMRRDALLVALLEAALESLGPDAAAVVAREVGLVYGRSVAGSITGPEATRSLKDAMASLAGLLSAHGFAARVDASEEAPTVVAANCPFGQAAQHHPVLCAVDRGLIEGLFEGIGASPSAITLTPRASVAGVCRVTT